ncbi:MAG: hypothetical protein OXG52_00410 [bacterium]|nr:hypothetical protein [bacterium]
MKESDIYGQVSDNREIFEAKYRRDLECTDLGRVALMHDGQVVDIFDDDYTASRAGFNRFPVGRFSTHPIGHPPTQLGCLGMSLLPA